MAGTIKNRFFGLPIQTINDLLTLYVNAQAAIALGKSVQIGSSTITREDSDTIAGIIQELTTAQRFASGQRVSRVTGNFACRRAWRQW